MKEFAITFADYRVVIAHECDNAIEAAVRWVEQTAYRFRDIIKIELVTDENRERIYKLR
jgi:hypothetical protein